MAKTLLSMPDLRWRALAEIRKQPGCSGVQGIAINRVSGVLRLTIEDNGPGLMRAAPNSDGRPRTGGLGLAGMRERLGLIGGLLEIESTTKGVTIFARIPLDQERLCA